MKKQKNYYARIGVALLLLCNPNIHVIDILPDFIAYFLLFSVLSEAADLTPHFAQAREACKKMAILGLFKIPAVFIVMTARSHNTTDFNLIPTFAIIFAIFEMILGYAFLYHVTEALFYLGERSDAASLISPFRLCTRKNGDTISRSILYRNQQPEVLRNLSYLFLFVKCFASFLPELLLLTRKQEYVGDFAGQTALMRFYPLALLCVIVLALSIGIYWLLLSRAFLRTVRKEGRFLSALHALAGEELIQRKERRELCSSYILAFSLLAIASLFSLNFMPIFCFALFLMLGTCWMRLPQALRRATRLLGIFSILTSLLQMLLIEMFVYDYDYASLLSSDKAKAAYTPCVIVAAINTALILALVITVFFSLRHTILHTLGVSPENERYGRTERRYHREINRFNVLFLALGVLSTVCRGIYIYLKGLVIFIPSSAHSVGTISHKWEFWPLVMTAIAIPYIIYSFYYMGVMKEEMKLTLDEEY